MSKDVIKKIIICEENSFQSVPLKRAIMDECLSEITEMADFDSTIKELKDRKKDRKELDVIFINSTIGGEESTKVVKTATKLFPGVKIVVSGGKDLSDELIAEMLNNGIVYFLTKPYKEVEVEGIVGRVCV